MLTSKVRTLFVWPIVLVIGLPVAGKALSSDKLDKVQRSLAGAGAIDCGVGRIKTHGNIKIYEDRMAADGCAAAAFEANKPFIVRYDTEMEEDLSRHSLGIVRTPQGQVHFLNYEYYPLWYRSTIKFTQAVCPEPEVITHFGKRGKRWEQVGCGTCTSVGTDNTGACIFPSKKP